MGFDIDQSPGQGTIRLHLASYISAAASRFSLDTTRAPHDLPAPLAMVRACSRHVPSPEEVDQHRDDYCQLVGVLIFVTTYVRVDAVSAVHFLARHLHAPGVPHLRLARRVLLYLWHSRHLGITYSPGDGSFEVSTSFMPGDSLRPPGLHAGSDSDWATGPSTTAFVIMLAGAAVGWAARVQRCASLSSVEAEFYALSEAVAETVHFRNLLSDVGVSLELPTAVFCDSRGARLMAMDVASSRRTRHIHRRWFFVQFYVDDKQVVIRELRGAVNFADCLSKCAGGKSFLAGRAYILGLLAS